MASDDESEDNPLEAERKAKHAYLKKEVLDLGYNSKLFMEYISKVRAPDIDQWAFDELQEIVKSFKAKFCPEDTPLSVSSIKSINIPNEPLKSLENLSTNPILEITPAPSVEEIKHETNSLQSKKCEKNELSNCPDLQVKVSEPQVTGGGIFSKKYVVYTITTMPLGWIVKRRYREFLWLRELLSDIYLGSYLPPIPAKKTKGNLEDKTIFKRQQFLPSI